MTTKEQISKLKNQFSENKNSHIFLVETNSQEECLVDLKGVIKSLLDADEVVSHQIDEETHLELIVVRPDGKDIKKDAVLALQERIKTKPILSDYIVYIITPAEALNDIAANKMLKTIEEPNPNIIGFLISSNVDLLLPTIKSRCEYMSMMYDLEEKDDFDEATHESVKSLIVALEDKNHVEYSKIKSDDKIYKDNFKEVEKILKTYYNTACNLENEGIVDQRVVDIIKNHNDFAHLIKKSQYLNTVFNKSTKNMNNDLLLEKIYIELKDVK